MQDLIKINLDSIKENPRAGQTRTRIAGGINITFTSTCRLDFLKEGIDYIITSTTFDKNGNYIYEGIIPNEETLKNKSFKDLESFRYKITDNSKYHEHKPLGEYLFHYEDYNVTCDCCGHNFVANMGKLLFTRCKYCDSANCYNTDNIKIETIKEALERKSKQ